MIKKIAIITDTHVGARSDSQLFLAHFEKFFSEVFFPNIDQLGIKTVLHLGDLLDRRKFINYYTLNKLKKFFIDELWKRDIDLHIILGNHDCFYKNTNEINSVEELFKEHAYSQSNKFHIYKEPREIELFGEKLLILPWVNSSNADESAKALKKSKAAICAGHLEIQGFQMNIGHTNEDCGFTPNKFNKFEFVFSGHYHHKSHKEPIYYLGSPYEMTFNDLNDPRGFHTFDFESRSLEFFQNPFKMFYKIEYDDTGKTFEDLLKFPFSDYKQCYVKLVIKNRTNQYWFDQFLDRLYKENPADLNVIDLGMENMYNEEDDDINESAIQNQDTLTIITQHIDSMKIEKHSSKLKSLMKELYMEALEFETMSMDDL